jgi:GrpB-like predicted nucleotidyltransferase (UPF0157 family)
MSPPIAVNLTAYNVAWPQIASIYAERLRVLGPTLAVVHHISSTAVPGMASKPIIDRMPLVTDLDELDEKREQA